MMAVDLVAMMCGGWSRDGGGTGRGVRYCYRDGCSCGGGRKWWW